MPIPLWRGETEEGGGIIQFVSFALQDSTVLSDFSWDKSLPAGEQEKGKTLICYDVQTNNRFKSETQQSSPLCSWNGKAIQRSAILRDYPALLGK